MSEATLQQLLSRLDAVTSRLEAVESKIAGGGSSAGGAPARTAESGARFVQDFDALVNDTVTPFVAQTQKLGNAELKKQVGLFNQAVTEQRKFLNVAAQSKQPSNDVLVKLLEPINKVVSEIIAIRDANRPNPQFNWLSTISEGVPAFGWVTVSPTPGPFVTEYRGNSQFYSNKILREFRGKDEEQVKWVNLFTDFMTGLIDYIKKHHTTGLSWNPSGGDASKLASSGAGSGSSSGPAPPPPQPTTPLTSAPSKSAAGGASALFASINAAGGGITSGLKKVTKEMKTKYRAPEERSAVVPADVAKKPTSAPKFGKPAAAKKMPPKLALEGNKWVVEFQEGNKNVVIESPEPKHVVYLYRCNNSVVQIKGKVNAITMDECKRTGIVFSDAIASCEVVNCQSVEIQCTGKVPNFAIDKTSGVQLYLGKEGLGTEIVTSKTDQFNVLIPKGDDLEELSVPEQFKTVIENGKLVTTHVEHA